jgi:phosphate transport system permease protein
LRSGIAIFVSELSPAALRQPLVFLTELLAAIPSIVYGLWGIFVLVPAVRALESATPAALRALTPLFSGPPLGLGHAVGRARPGRHGGAVHFLGVPRGP